MQRRGSAPFFLAAAIADCTAGRASFSESDMTASADGAIAYAGHDFHQRIELLSRVRNAALEPLWDGEDLWRSDHEEETRVVHRRRHPQGKEKC